jgi:hypothetical protein
MATQAGPKSRRAAVSCLPWRAISWYPAIARALCGQAIAGNVQGIREVADRLDGKVPQTIAGIDDDENLAPLTATINLGRAQPRSPPKTVARARK